MLVSDSYLCIVSLVNPQHTCSGKVMVVILSVCVYVSVCLSARGLLPYTRTSEIRYPSVFYGVFKAIVWHFWEMLDSIVLASHADHS